MIPVHLLIFLASLLVSILLTKGVRDTALARGWVDPPSLDRHVHVAPVPRLGGVAIFASFLIMVTVGLALQAMADGWALPNLSHLPWVLGAALIVFVMGLYDDLRSLSASWKFAIQIVAAVLLYVGGLGIHQLSLLFHGDFLDHAIGLPLTVLWVLLITNAFNLIDGLDGLAAGSALFSTLVVFLVALRFDNGLVVLLSAILAGTILGFLRFNFYPASIFLGDSGSQLIGFLLGALALMGSQKAPTMIAVAIPVISFGLPILDVVMAVVRRFLRMQPLFKGDDEHIHHKLLKRGVSQRGAVLILYGVTAAFGFLSLVALHGRGTIAFVLAVLAVGVFTGVQYLYFQEIPALRRFAWTLLRRRHILANDLRVRGLAESLRRCRTLPEISAALQEGLQAIGFDGYALQLNSLETLNGRSPLNLSSESENVYEWSWGLSTHSGPSWQFGFDLVDSVGCKYGSLRMFKGINDHRPVLVDMNLLVQELQVVLSEAACRALGTTLCLEKSLAETAVKEVPEVAPTSGSD